MATEWEIFKKSKIHSVTFFALLFPTFWPKNSFLGPFVIELMRFEGIFQKSRSKLKFLVQTLGGLKAIGGGVRGSGDRNFDFDGFV